MAALEVITGDVTAPGATLTDLTMNAGNSLTVRNTQNGSPIRMIGAWNKNQTAGLFSVRSPFLHDNVNGFEVGAPADDVFNKLDEMVHLTLEPQDTLTAQLSGSSTGGDLEIASMLIHYEDLPGVEARLIGPEELNNRMEHVMAVQNTLTIGSGGTYDGEEAINAEQDQFKANRDYALIGYEVSTRCATVGWRGSDTGNLRVGGPGSVNHRDQTRTWFVSLSKMYQTPLIPVFNAANKGAFLIDAVQDEDVANVTVTSIFALLSSS